MKKLIKIVAIVATILVSLILLLALYINVSSMPVHEVTPLPIQVTYDSAAIYQGKKIVETVCYTCHRGTDEKLSGGLFSQPESALGEIWSGNLTKDPIHGLGRYSDGEIAYMLRTGINREGRFIGPFMLFPNMADQDLAAVIAYLRSDSPITQPVEITRPQPSYSFLANALLKLGAMKPLAAPDKPIYAPAPSDLQSYGKYLATSVYACYECHSKSFETNNVLEPEKSEGYFAGGNPVEDRNFDIVVSPNLTPSIDQGIGTWSKEDFTKAIKHGVATEDRVLNTIMPRFSLLSDQEVDAIWSYLRSIPAAEGTTMAASK